MHVLQALTIIREEDTNVVSERLVAIRIDTIAAVEEVPELWGRYTDICSVRTDIGDVYYVKEPYLKIFDLWLAYLESGTHKGIFSAS